MSTKFEQLMTNSTLNETFISKRDFEEESVNEKLLFNTALLEECKEYTEKIEIDLKKFGGKLYPLPISSFYIDHRH